MKAYQQGSSGQNPTSFCLNGRIDLDKQIFERIIVNILPHVLGAQKNRLIEAVLLNAHNICFGRDIRKVFFL